MTWGPRGRGGDPTPLNGNETEVPGNHACAALDTEDLLHQLRCAFLLSFLGHDGLLSSVTTIVTVYSPYTSQTKTVNVGVVHNMSTAPN